MKHEEAKRGDLYSLLYQEGLSSELFACLTFPVSPYNISLKEKSLLKIIVPLRTQHPFQKVQVVITTLQSIK